MIAVVLAVLLFFLWIRILWKRRKFYLLCLKLPGPLGYPIIGMAYALRNKEEIIKNFKKYEEKYGPLLYSWLGPKPALVVSEPQFAQDVLTAQGCVNKSFVYEAVNITTGHGLFSLREPEWSRHRKLLNPAFSYKSLAGLMSIFNQETGRFLDVLGAECGKGEVDVKNKLQRSTLVLAMKTTLGEDVMAESSSIDTLLHAYQELLQIMTQMCFFPWLRIKFIRWMFRLQEPFLRSRTQIRSYIKKVIQKKLQASLSTSPSPSTESDGSGFLNLNFDLLKKGSFSFDNVDDEVNAIVFGAFETTANQIFYTLMLLAMFPCHQQKLFEEIKSFFSATGDFEVKMSEVQQLVFLDMVLNEAMRVIAPVPLVARETSKDVELSNGIVIPAGVTIAIDIFNMHRREDIWGDDSNKFNPENFLPTNLEGKHSYAFIPFTKGIRSCIGSRYAMLSIKVALIKIIRNYKFKTSFIFEDLCYVEDITVKLRKTPLLELSRRDS